MTAPALTLEPLRWWQLPAVTTIEAELFADESPWTEAMFWSELAQQHYYLACSDGPTVVGYAGLASYPDEAQVQTIAVAPKYQGRGVGRRLLTALLTAAGPRRVLLEVRTTNEPALTLYKSMGFQQIGIRRGYYQPSGADAYTMERRV